MNRVKKKCPKCRFRYAVTARETNNKKGDIKTRFICARPYEKGICENFFYEETALDFGDDNSEE